MAFTRIVNVDDSSQIVKVMYDVERNKLSVKFKNKSTYVYEGVPASVFGELVSAPSVGVYFGSYVRNNYIGQKLG